VLCLCSGVRGWEEREVFFSQQKELSMRSNEEQVSWFR
jgi:hypothetical protein